MPKFYMTGGGNTHTHIPHTLQRPCVRWTLLARLTPCSAMLYAKSASTSDAGTAERTRRDQH